MVQEIELYNLPMEDEVQMKKTVYELEQMEKAGVALPDEVQDWMVFANNRLWSA
jgi:hypothetical protein